MAGRIASGDESAVSELVMRNAGLARKMALKYRVQGYELEDLVQEALLGMTIAARRFDAGRGVRFGTFAGRWIQGTVGWARDSSNLVMRVRARRRLGLPEYEVNDSIDPAPSDSEESPFDVADDSCPDPVSRTDAGRVLSALGDPYLLRPKERYVLLYRLGTDHTLLEIAESLGLSRERVRQLESSGLEKLRRHFSGRAARLIRRRGRWRAVV